MDANTHLPADPQEAPLYLRTDVSPEEIFIAIGKLRKEARPSDLGAVLTPKGEGGKRQSLLFQDCGLAS